VRNSLVMMKFAFTCPNSDMGVAWGLLCSLKSENIEILPILLAPFLVRIFYQPYLIYMPSLVEITSVVSDISEVKDFDICSRFP
jgi:hypothetical protein